MKFFFFSLNLKKDFYHQKPGIWKFGVYLVIKESLFNKFHPIFVVVWLKGISKLRVYFSKNWPVNNYSLGSDSQLNTAQNRYEIIDSFVVFWVLPFQSADMCFEIT